ncbi:MAG: ABC transporter permease [Melioribacteraceae bacterium]|nr:ABC transporter permease [Melioribacteraceae bacterium]
MFEFFIAKRYLRSKHKINFITILTFLSTMGVTIGVAALIVMLSVFNGFGSLVTSLLVEFDPHLRVTNIEHNIERNTIVSKVNQLKNVTNVGFYAEGKIIAVNKKSYEILTLKGIDENLQSDDWGVKSKIVSGKFDVSSQGNIDKIILGLPIALRLSARVGDTIFVSSARSIERSVLSLSTPKSKPYIVAGLFEAKSKEYDYNYSFTSLESAQEMLALKNNVTGLEIRLTEIDQAEKLKPQVASIFSEQASVYSWYDLHEDLYNVMMIERWAAYILLALIIAVATFNILSSLTMSVIEKKKDIALLRSMGATKKSVLRIFMFEGILIGLIGTGLGMIIGYVICWLQINYNFYPLDPTKYIVNSLPVLIRTSDFFVVGFASFILTFLASLYPAKRGVNISITDAIKWE